MYTVATLLRRQEEVCEKCKRKVFVNFATAVPEDLSSICIINATRCECGTYIMSTVTKEGDNVYFADNET